MSEEARKAEASDNTTAEVEFRGRTFTVSRDYDDWPVALVEALEQGHTVGICSGALGPAQWRQVQAMNLAVKELVPLMEGIATALGFKSAGE